MSHWLVSIPAWGPRCVDLCLRAALPSLRASDGMSGHQVKVIVHTDQPSAITLGAGWLDVEAWPTLKSDEWWEILSQAHRDVVNLARVGDRILLLTADMVMSKNMLATCDRYLGMRKKIICCAGIRAVDNGHYAPVGLDSRMLLKWAWDNRHPLTQASLWPDGQSGDLSRLYFQSGSDVNSRTWSPHPIAIVKTNDRHFRFSPTIDANLIDSYIESDIQLITNPDEGAAIELSPVDKPFHVAGRMEDRVAGQEIKLRRRSSVRRWLMSQRITICGSGSDAGDEEVARRILKYASASDRRRRLHRVRSSSATG